MENLPFPAIFLKTGLEKNGTTIAMQAWVLIWLFFALLQPLLVISIIHNLVSNDSESDGRSPYCFHESG